jgi:hypothetical protein
MNVYASDDILDMEVRSQLKLNDRGQEEPLDFFYKLSVKKGTFMQSVLHRSLGAGGSGEKGLGARGSCWNRLDQDIGLVRHAPHERPCSSSSIS